MIERVGDPVVYLDANIFIYVVEGDDSIAAPMNELLFKLRRRPGAAITSELTLAEVLSPGSAGTPRAPNVRRRYFDLIVWSNFIRLHPVSRDVLVDTARVRAINRMKLPDSIHLCTAIRNNCRFLLSRDRRIKTPSTMKLVPPDSVAIAEVLQELDR